MCAFSSLSFDHNDHTSSLRISKQLRSLSDVINAVDLTRLVDVDAEGRCMLDLRFTVRVLFSS